MGFQRKKRRRGLLQLPTFRFIQAKSFASHDFETGFVQSADNLIPKMSLRSHKLIGSSKRSWRLNNYYSPDLENRYKQGLLYSLTSPVAFSRPAPRREARCVHQGLWCSSEHTCHLPLLHPFPKITFKVQALQQGRV